MHAISRVLFISAGYIVFFGIFTPFATAATCTSVPAQCASGTEIKYAYPKSSECIQGGYYCARTFISVGKTATNLSFGAKGSRVSELQQHLRTLGYLTSGQATGYFGTATIAAVKKLQCKELRICSGTRLTTGYGSVGATTSTTILALIANIASSQGRSVVVVSIPPPSQALSTSALPSSIISVPRAAALTNTTTVTQPVTAEPKVLSLERTPAPSVINGTEAAAPSAISRVQEPPYYDFGGMYGYAVGNVVYTNPATNAASCPGGYTAYPFIGSVGFDYPAYACLKKSVVGSEGLYDFGGMYGYAVGNVTYNNPATNAASCPAGYTSAPVIGSVGFDFPAYFCYRESVSGSPGIFDLGGVYGQATGGVQYNNPATDAQSCPVGYQSSPFIGSTGTDYPAYMCYRDPNVSASCKFGAAVIPNAQTYTAYEKAEVSDIALCKSELRRCNAGVLDGTYPYASCKAICLPLGSETRTLSCANGGTGSITQKRTSTCPGPTWSAWVETANTCATPVGTSCALDGVTVAEGTSKQFYLARTVPTGTSCADTGVSLTRTCTNGSLTGSSAFSKATCSISSIPVTNMVSLAGFTPYVWSTAWYTYYDNTQGTNPPPRGLALLKKHIDDIKFAGINTLWMGGNHIWMQLQPTAGIWDHQRVADLKELLSYMKSKNMHAIFQLNYIGPGWAPVGIDGCNWFKDPAQVKKFTQFATELGGILEEYNDIIYYMVYTEQVSGCSNSTEVLQNSIGSFTRNIPPAIRKQMFIGMHDELKQGAIPIGFPNDFDYMSFVYYPFGTQYSYRYNDVLNELDRRLAKVRAVAPTLPVMIGEFGWPANDGSTMAPMKNSAIRYEAHKAMIDWSIVNKVGFNVWAWLPRYIDNPAEEPSAYESALQIILRDGTKTDIVDLLRCKLVTGVCP